MAKSIGTLAAKLILDTKGWFAGFGAANKVSDKFSKQISGRLGPDVTAVSRRMFRLGVTAIIAAKGVRAVGNSFERLAKKDAAVADASRAITALGNTVSDITDKFIVELAPAVKLFADGGVVGIAAVARAMSNLGITVGTVGAAVREIAIGFMLQAKAADAFTRRLEASAQAKKALDDQLAAGREQGAAAAAAFKNPSAENLAKEAAAFERVKAAGQKVSAAQAAEKLAAQDFADVFNGKVLGQIEKGLKAPGGKALGGEGAGPKTQAAVERGTVEAAKVIQGIGGNPIAALHKVQAEALVQIRELNQKTPRNPRPAVALARLN